MIDSDLSERALVVIDGASGLTPEVGALLALADLAVQECGSIEVLVQELGAGAAFAVVTEEALATAELEPLTTWIERQEEWSDFPFIVLTCRGDGLQRNAAAARFLDLLRNVTFLEQSLHPTTLTSVARSALRARRRQYQTRHYLQALRAGNQRFRAAVDAVEGVVWTNDPSGRMMGEQPGWSALTGQTIDEYEGFGWADAVHPDDAQPTIDAWNMAVAEQRTFVFDHRVKRRDGEWRHFAIRGVPVQGPDGEIQEWVGVHTDISEERLAAEALKEETRILETLNGTGIAIAAELDLHRAVQGVTDAGVSLTGAAFGAFFYNVVNQVGERMMLYALSGAERDQFERFGMPRATSVFKPTFVGDGPVRSDDILLDHRYGKNAPHRGMPEGHLPVRSYLAVPVVGRSGEVIGGLFFGHPDTGRFTERHERLIEGIASQAAVAIDNARLYQSLQAANDTLEQRVSEEIEKRASVEDALRQTQKMEAIGQLTGGIAHDFNNLLMVIQSSLELLKKYLPTDPRADRLIEGALAGAQRGASLTQRLLAFARRQDLQLEPRRMTDIILGMTELLERSLGSSIELQIAVPSTGSSVLVDANQVEMAILNLALNARDAMPVGGTLRMEVDEVVSEDPAGHYVRLSVIDTGVGMSDEVLQKAIEPFFSTKGVGKGTGLGLPMVHGLAVQLNGSLRLSSAVGQGTRAELLLPVTASSERAGAPAQEQVGGASSQLPRRTRVLAVDDDILVCMATTSMLDDLGFDVVEAHSGSEALKILDRGERVDLLLTDFSMPKMNGAELAIAARERQPGLPILVATGYADLPVGESLNLPRLSKPYRQEQLNEEIRKLLQSVDR